MLEVDVGWVNGNYQRILFHSVRTASADLVRRIAVLEVDVGWVNGSCFTACEPRQPTGVRRMAAPKPSPRAGVLPAPSVPPSGAPD